MKIIIYISLLCIFFISCSKNNKSNPSSQILKSEMSDMLLTGGTVVSNGFQITASNIESPTQVYHPVYTTIERMTFKTSFVVTDDNTIIRIGKGLCYAEIDGTAMRVYGIASDYATSTLVDTVVLPFSLTKNTKYNISIQKIDGYKLKYSLVYADNSFEKVYNVKASEILDSKMISVVRAWGNAFFGVKNGSVVVTDAVISTGYNANTSVSFWGDSFLDAANLIANGGTLEDRYCDLVAQHLGYEKVPIMAKTGQALDTDFISRFKDENRYLRSKYVFMALGTNNVNLNDYKIYMQQCIDEIKINGQIPILVTITPRPDVDYQSVTKVMNDWVKASGEKYVDICDAVTDGAGNWKPEYVTPDNTHPSVAGNRAMFRQIQLDVPEILL